MLEGKKILIGITGSIAAYKTILLVRLLVKAGAEVKVIMTPSAGDFVSKLTLSTLSKNPVLILGKSCGIRTLGGYNGDCSAKL
jgi:phosphopantothenoylcysteine decarboxylase/phosphopantothenate--cysteine ligase